MASEEFNEAKRIANELKPVFNIGKNAVTRNLIEAVDKYLEANKIVKIKVLDANDKEQVKFYSQQIADETNSEVVQKIGFTFTLFRN